jgi:TRAP-type C4-dicarboxylate transport system permease small subunit
MSTLESAPGEAGTTKSASAADLLARLFVWVCGSALIGMSFVITIEALMRKFLDHSFGGVDEITSYVFAVTATWAFPLAVLHRSNIRIDIVRAHLPVRARLVLDLIAWASFTVVFAFITYRAAALAWDSWQTGARSISPLRSYLVIPQGLWALGLVLCLVTSFLVGLQALARLAHHETRAAGALLAPGDEVAEELATIHSIAMADAAEHGDETNGPTS